MAQATAHGKSLTISPKYAFMVCQYIRGRKVARAKAILEAAIAGREAIPFTRFNDGVGHRTGIAAAGRYPVKASQAILALINSAEANAKNDGLAGELIITEIRANRASSPMRQGRQSRRTGKRTHVHVTLEELESKRVTKATKVTVQTPPASEPEKPSTEPKKTTVDETKEKVAPASKKKAAKSTKSAPVEATQ